MNNSPIFSARSRASVFTRSASWTCWGVAVVFSITLRNGSLLTQVTLPRSTCAWISFGSNGFAAILASELNGSPVASAPSFARASSEPIVSQISANRNGFDRLMIENS